MSTVLGKASYEAAIAATRDERMAWWRDARFGMFVHYGLYAQLGRNEWAQSLENCPVEEYAKLAETFAPKPGAPREWAKLAKAAGAKYMVLTTRHHEGFSLWDSKVNPFNSVNYGPHRDIVREFVDACREFDLKIGFYSSLMDWHHPDGWKCAYDNEARRRFLDYIEALNVELLTQYGHVDILWYDVSAPMESWEGWDSLVRNQHLREIQPHLIINDRSKLAEDFDIASTHMLLVDANLPSHDVRNMKREMEDVDGVKYVLSLESVVGSRVPEEVLPDSVRSILKSDRWELMLINSEYKVASDAVNDQIDSLNAILKKYDPSGMLIGEAPCTKDMIETTGHDFQVVNLFSIIAIFVIILLVEKSLSLPVILIAVIELAIFINLGLPHYLGQSLPFIAPICISTIQLGATVDYAILMTTRYKAERVSGKSKYEAVSTALATSVPSIIVSGMGLFAATFGVAVYSNIDIVSSMCMLMARGALISVVCVILMLPAFLMLLDGVVRHTTLNMKVKE